MNRHALLSLLALLLCCSTSLPAQKAKTYIPWKNGKLVVSEEGRYLKHENGVPFFWLGETGWLMPQRLNRDEVSYYLNKCKDAGYNMVQVQVLNGVPSMNIYGQYSMTETVLISKISTAKGFMDIGITWTILLKVPLHGASI